MSVFRLCERAIGYLRGNRLILEPNERAMLEALNYEGLAEAQAQDEALSCTRHFEYVRDALMAAHPWVFLRREANLARLTGGADGWKYAFALPADCLRVLRVMHRADPRRYPLYQHLYEPRWINDGRPDPNPYTMEDNWEVSSGRLLCNHREVSIRYTARITDTEAWDPLFCDVFCLRLAAEMAAEVVGQAGLIGNFAELEAARTDLARASGAIRDDVLKPKHTEMWLDYSGFPTFYDDWGNE